MSACPEKKKCPSGTTERRLEPGECVSNLSSRALDCKSCSAQVVYSGTQDISLAGDFATLVMDKAQFLGECSTMIAPMWVGVKSGSIVFDCGRRNTGDPRRCSDHDDISGTEPA